MAVNEETRRGKVLNFHVVRETTSQPFAPRSSSGALSSRRAGMSPAHAGLPSAATA